MAKGFKLIDADIGWRPKDPRGWWIERVEASFAAPKTLTISMYCGQAGSEEAATIKLIGFTSFRVQHEREMVDYWQQMRAEGVAQGLFYAVETSDYLNDLAGGVSPLAHPQVHYLMVAEDECLDFLGPDWATPLSIEVTFGPAQLR